jgi:hypothetical protein
VGSNPTSSATAPARSRGLINQTNGENSSILREFRLRDAPQEQRRLEMFRPE